VTSSGGRPKPEPTTLYRSLVENGVEAPVDFFFGGEPKADGTAEYRSIQHTAELRKDLLKLVAVWRSKESKHLSEKLVSEYDCVRQPEGYITAQFIDLRVDDHLSKALKSLKPAADTPVWTTDDAEVGKPRSFVIEAKGATQSKIRFFGRITKGQQLVGPGRMLAFVEGDRFRALIDQKVFVIDARFDCVEVGPYMFILRSTGFESLFAYETSLKERADERIESLAPYVAADKIRALKVAIGTNRNLLRQISGRIRIDLKTADPARIQAAVTKCHLNVIVDTSGKVIRLSFQGDDPQGLIQLLTDRAVEGIVSGTSYIAPALQDVAD
jgi:hypothetical protein